MIVMGSSLGMAVLFALLLELPADDPLQRVIEMRQKITALDLEVEREIRRGSRTPEARPLRWTCLDDKLRNDFPIKIISQDGTVAEARGVVCLGCYEEQDRKFIVNAARPIVEGGPKRVIGSINEIAALDKQNAEIARGTLDMRKISLSSSSFSFGGPNSLEYTDLQALVPVPSSESSPDANITVRDYRDTYGRVHRYWFDAKQGNQIVRHMNLGPKNVVSGVPDLEVRVENQPLGDTGIWFPKQVIDQRFSDDAEHRVEHEEKNVIRIVSFDREECELRMELAGIEILKPGDLVSYMTSDGVVNKTWNGIELVGPAIATAKVEQRRKVAKKPVTGDFASWTGVGLAAILIVTFAMPPMVLPVVLRVLAMVGS